MTTGTGTRLVIRGHGSIPAALRRAGWWHIGDPDARYGYLLDAYQTVPARRAKLFVLTDPTGHSTRYRHRLVTGEQANNSFVTIAPSGQWFLSGEWHTITRLLMFPMPQLNRQAPRPAADLPLAAVVRLAHPMRNVQGCAFATHTVLVCATNDHRRDLYPIARQLLLLRLSRPLDGHLQTAVPTLLGPIPQDPSCRGIGETEGVDLTGDTLRVTVNTASSCSHTSLIWRYTRHDTADSRPARPAARRVGFVK